MKSEAAYRFNRDGTRGLSPVADEVLAADRRQPFLLLRAFGDDEQIFLSPSQFMFYVFRNPDYDPVTSVSSLEEVLVMCLSRYGPTIAIGRPGEWAPPLGAARIYVSAKDDWHQEVLDLVHASRLIFVIVSATDGLLWEIDTLVRMGLLPKVIFVFPPAEDVEIQRRWQRIVDSDPVSSQLLPRTVPAGAVLATFDRRNELLFHGCTPPGGRSVGMLKSIRFTKPLTELLRRLPTDSSTSFASIDPAGEIRRTMLDILLGLVNAAISGICLLLFVLMPVPHKHSAANWPAALQAVYMFMLLCSIAWSAFACLSGIGLFAGVRSDWSFSKLAGILAVVVIAAAVAYRFLGGDEFGSWVAPMLSGLYLLSKFNR